MGLLFGPFSLFFSGLLSRMAVKEIKLCFLFSFKFCFTYFQLRKQLSADFSRSHMGFMHSTSIPSLKHACSFCSFLLVLKACFPAILTHT